MCLKDDCYSYQQYTSLQKITKLAELIQSNLNLKTRIDMMDKGHYGIYIHHDQNVLDQLVLTEPTKAKKAPRKNNKKALVSEEERLLKELEAVRKKLKKTT